MGCAETVYGDKFLNHLYELYGQPSEEFVNGFIAAMEYFAGDLSRISLTLYGRPVTREVLELEKKQVVAVFTQEEEEIKL